MNSQRTPPRKRDGRTSHGWRRCERRPSAVVRRPRPLAVSRMCTLLAVLGLVPGYPLVVAMNRDEFYDRPAVPPSLRPGTPKIMMPRDERAEGTWIGVNEFGVVAAVSNRFAGQPDPRARSRGLLCLESLAHPNAAAAAGFVVKEAALRLYNPFNLFHADPTRVTCTSREGGATFVRDGTRGAN